MFMRSSTVNPLGGLLPNRKLVPTLSSTKITLSHASIDRLNYVTYWRAKPLTDLSEKIF